MYELTRTQLGVELSIKKDEDLIRYLIKQVTDLRTSHSELYGNEFKNLFLTKAQRAHKKRLEESIKAYDENIDELRKEVDKLNKVLITIRT